MVREEIYIQLVNNRWIQSDDLIKGKILSKIIVNKSHNNSKDRVIDLIRFVIFFQLAIVGATIFGCFRARCDKDVKQHIANMMTVITTSTFALYAAEK